MDTKRRLALRTLVAASLAPLATTALCGPALGATPAPAPGPINIILPKSRELSLDGDRGRAVQARLTRAVMDYVEEHYGGGNLPVWHRPYKGLDLEKRVANICYWIVGACRERRDVYPVDPAWVAGQIMTESFFCEFAVSRALAVGICQFIGPTAREYGMATAGADPAHAAAPFKRPQDACAEAEYYERRGRWKKALRARRRLSGDETEFIRQALRAHLDGKPIPKAQEFLDAAERVDALDDEVKDARARFTAYLEANFQGRSIFDSRDVAFFKGFDERVLYAAPVDAMVLMLARFLRARGGNILAAAAGYHSGLGNTREEFGVYKRYGRIPAFADTVGYVSRCLVNHHEIALRMA